MLHSSVIHCLLAIAELVFWVQLIFGEFLGVLAPGLALHSAINQAAHGVAAYTDWVLLPALLMTIPCALWMDACLRFIFPMWPSTIIFAAVAVPITLAEVTAAILLPLVLDKMIAGVREYTL